MFDFMHRLMFCFWLQVQEMCEVYELQKAYWSGELKVLIAGASNNESETRKQPPFSMGPKGWLRSLSLNSDLSCSPSFVLQIEGFLLR